MYNYGETWENMLKKYRIIQKYDDRNEEKMEIAREIKCESIERRGK